VRSPFYFTPWSSRQLSGNPVNGGPKFNMSIAGSNPNCWTRNDPWRHA